MKISPVTRFQGVRHIHTEHIPQELNKPGENIQDFEIDGLDARNFKPWGKPATLRVRLKTLIFPNTVEMTLGFDKDRKHKELAVNGTKNKIVRFIAQKLIPTVYNKQERKWLGQHLYQADTGAWFPL